MAREITPGVKRKVLALRKKYCSDLCSDYYMRTGIPLIEKEKIEESKKDISRLLKESKKVQQKAIREALKNKGLKKKDIDEKNVIWI